MLGFSDLVQMLSRHGADALRLVPGERLYASRGGAEEDVGPALTSGDVRGVASEVVSSDDLDQLSARPRVVRHEHGGVLYLVELTAHRLGAQVSVRPAAPRAPAAEKPAPAAAAEERPAPAAHKPQQPVTLDEVEATRPAARKDDPAPPPEEPRRGRGSRRMSRALAARNEQEPPASRRGRSKAPSRRPDPEPAAVELARVNLRPPAAPVVDVAAKIAPPPAPVVVRTGPAAIESLLREMKELDASDLHLTTESPPVMRIHGEMRFFTDRPALTSSKIEELVREIMPPRAAQDFDTTRDADFAFEIVGYSRFRVNVFRDRKGVGAVIRKIPIDVLTAEQLGIPKAVVDLCYLTKGLVLVTGPTGSGKSTTLAALIDFINRNREDHIITIEDPIEFVHQNQRCLVNQREVGSHTGSFKSALRAALREDPDVILVGELRDLETIAIAIETAETGHLVFGTLHTSTAMSTVDRMVDQFPPDRQAQIRVMLAESLKGVVSQVLCKKVGGGRVAALEVLLGNSAVTAIIRDGKTHQLTNVMQTGKGAGMRTLNDALMEHLRAGRIDGREAYLKAVDKAGLLAMFKAAGLPSPI